MDPVKDSERIDLDLKVDTARVGQTLAAVQHRLGKEEVFARLFTAGSL